MTDSIRVFDPGFRVTDANGEIVSGALIKFYEAGGTTPLEVFSDSGLSVSLGVEVECNAAGAPSSDGSAPVLIYTGTDPYRVRITDSGGTLIPGMDFDNIPGALNTTPFAAATFAKPDTDCAADTSDTTLTTADLGTVRNGNPTGGTFTYTLPSAITAGNGRGYTFRHVGTANSIIIATVSAQTIDGATTKTLSGRYESITIVSDGANWHIEHDANRTVVGGTITPQGYLTLTSGTPIIAADVIAGTAVYYTPFTGNLLPIYDGTRYVNYEFSELTLTLASQFTLSTIWDVFGFLSSGVVTIGALKWTTSTAGSGAKGTGADTPELVRTKGLLNLANATTIMRNGASAYSVGAQRATYLGSIFIDGTAGQVTCHVGYGQSRKWGVWNAYNRRPLLLKAGDGTASWTYGTNTLRPSNNATANSLTIFAGLAEEGFNLAFQQKWGVSGVSGGAGQVAIGYNSTTAASGFGPSHSAFGVSGGANISAGVALVATYDAPPALGIQVITSLEAGVSGSATWSGTELNSLLTAKWRG